MSFVYDNLAVIYVALVTSLMGWLYGGTNADVLSSVAPWLLLFMAEVLVVFPQKNYGETTYKARERVWKNMKRDPLVWTALMFMIILAIPFVNNGLCVGCDAKLIALGHSPEPPVKILPFCVNRVHHYNVFLWFAVALSSLVTVRHCLASRGQRLLIKMIVWNGFLLAILGFVQIASGAPGPLWQEMSKVTHVSTFFSSFGYPNMAGDYFTTLFGLSIAVWRNSNTEIDEELKASRSPSEKQKRTNFWRRHFTLVPTVFFFLAAVSTLSRAAILLVCLMLFVCFVHSLIDMTHKMSKKDRVKKGTIAVVIVSLVAFFSVISMPEDVQRELDTLGTDAVLTRVTGKGQYHVRVATQVWLDHKLFGCGGWGYKHFCGTKMTAEDRLQQVGGINVHNDYLQFLAEHGLVGFGAMVFIVFLLIAPIGSVWKKLVKSARFADKKKAPASPIQVFAMPAPIFIILLTALSTFIHGFADCPFRSPAVMTLFFVSLACMPGYLPKEKDHAAR